MDTLNKSILNNSNNFEKYNNQQDITETRINGVTSEVSLENWNEKKQMNKASMCKRTKNTSPSP